MNARTPFASFQHPNWSASTRRLNALIARADAAERKSPRIARTPAQLARIMPNDNPTARRNAIALLAADNAEYAVATLLDVLAAARADDREAFLGGLDVLDDELRALAPAPTTAADLRAQHDDMLAAFRANR